MVKPEASSTPKIVDISRRPPIGGVNNDSVQSPIPCNTLKSENLKEKSYDSNCTEEDDYFESNDESDNSIEIDNTTFCNCIHPSCFTMLAILIILVGILYGYTGQNRKVICAEILSQEFPSQIEDFWIYIQEGVEDIERFNQPKTFVFLYNDESEGTLQKILNRIGSLATCALTNCAAVPIVLEATELSTKDVIDDYGKIISRNKEKLEKSGVMIVKNLEQVPGTSAQAFHSFCDEYNPVVKKALFIFTMKIEKFHENNLEHIENDLRSRWKDIKDDIFYALFTRIANVVLPVTAEK